MNNMNNDKFPVPSSMIQRLGLCSIFVLLLSHASVSAHHAAAAQFDVSRTIELKGVIEKFEWANPHIHVYLAVKRDRDRVEHWDVEFPSPGGVIVAGLSRELLKPGTTITVEGYPSKSAATAVTPAACATKVTLSDGASTKFVVGI